LFTPDDDAGRYQDFTSGYFDVVVAESVTRPFMEVIESLTHFDALHIGLTATRLAYIERNTLSSRYR